MSNEIIFINVFQIGHTVQIILIINIVRVYMPITIVIVLYENKFGPKFSQNLKSEAKMILIMHIAGVLRA